MANGNVLTNSMRKVMINRAYKATPTYTAPTVFKVGTGTTTPAVGNTDLVTPVIISGGVYIKSVVSGYPLLDETNFISSMRCLLLTTDANANSITEFGLFNTDGTPLCCSRCVFPAIAKTTSIQIIFIEKDKLV